VIVTGIGEPSAASHPRRESHLEQPANTQSQTIRPLVSQVNDDHHDNYFLDPVGRFAAIEEDEAPERLLWSELKNDSARSP
jgi:D-lyxose ketol-isomerase